jgi:DtxR family transcriptional regulator, Mn-dependent transcriptional regulator
MNMQFSYTEENYLKSIYHLCDANIKGNGTSTNHIAIYLNIKPATVTNMLQKLCEKKLIRYKPYSKVTLTNSGKMAALQVIRKHRLWEVFLVNKLAFTWDQVHDVAEQLEHIQSVELIDKLDAYLQYPAIDPHGDPIPNANGEVVLLKTKKLSDIAIGQRCKVVAVNDNNIELLKYLSEISIGLGTTIEVEQIIHIAETICIIIKQKKINISFKTAEHISVL